LPMVLQTEFARQKKKFPAWNIPTAFIPSVISWFTDDSYPSVNASVNVAATVKCRQIQSVGKTLCNSFF
jgi:uncharacterized membrane protein